MANKLGGKITELLVDRGQVNIVLDNDPTQGPKFNRFVLEQEHTSFNSAYSLLLAAAANRWPVSIRIGGDGEIDANVEATVKRVAVGFR